MLGNPPEALNFNHLFLKLCHFICDSRPVLSLHWQWVCCWKPQLLTISAAVPDLLSMQKHVSGAPDSQGSCANPLQQSHPQCQRSFPYQSCWDLFVCRRLYSDFPRVFHYCTFFQGSRPLHEHTTYLLGAIEAEEYISLEKQKACC